MTTVPVPVSAPGPAITGGARVLNAAGLAGRLLVGAALAAAGVLAMVRMLDFQFREAALAAWAIDLFGRPSRVLTTEPTFLFQKVVGDDTSWSGLVVTSECTAALFVGGTLVLGGLLLVAWRHAGAWRLLAATALTVGLLLTVNTARMVLIGEAASRWGAEGFGWAHTVVGSVLMLATFCACALLFVRVGLLRGRD
ncbi:archaeosortase/exosortase family protein [Cellulosimicrobium cellulans]|uniref:archaeosortase/exosortase family protein n=1 Tax=Cellulosimicrobium cellulans TaxID=1710 RepID=UPI0024074FD0|nr:archaeosortase/exosortase family protein [Cellulosimicrobium cellulans]MDF9877570.1 exosortase/archaeosortase family protein [Cellulosimicrobium cellulans]